MQRLVRVFLAATLILAPVGAQAADLVVWWEKGYDDRENEAVREIIATFEQETGKRDASVDDLPEAPSPLPAEVASSSLLILKAHISFTG
jgi:hypothetical protein